MIQRPRRTFLCAFSMAFAGLAASATAAPPRYTLTNLGVMPGGSFTTATGINNSGHVVGNGDSNDPLPFTPRAFFNNGSMHVIGAMNSANASEAWAINNADTVAGRSYSDVSMDAVAFTWTLAGGGHALNAGASNAYAWGINAAGQVAGTRNTTSFKATVFNPDNTFVEFGRPADTFYSEAHAINNNGQVVGFGSSSNNSHLQGFVYTLGNPPGAVISLATLGGTYSNGLAINDSAQIVGSAWLANGDEHACQWISGSATDLGTLSGGAYSVANAINAQGVIVGDSTTAANPYDTQGFVYLQGLMYDLTSQLDSSASGWTIITARAINDYGQIAATAVNPAVGDGSLRAVLLTPVVSACKPAWSGTDCLGPLDLLGYLNLYFTNYDGHGSAVPATDQSVPQANPTSSIYAVPCTPSAPGVFPVIPAAGLKADFDGDCQITPSDLLSYLNGYFNPTESCFAGCGTRGVNSLESTSPASKTSRR